MPGPGKSSLGRWGLGFGRKVRGLGWVGGQVGPRDIPLPQCGLCSSAPHCPAAARAENHSLQSCSLHCKGPVGDPPLAMPGHPHIQKDSPALALGLPIPTSCRHVLLPWRPGRNLQPPSPCFLDPYLSLPTNVSSLFPFSFHPRTGAWDTNSHSGTQSPH